MPQDQSNNAKQVRHPSEEFGTVRNDAESFRTIPKASESFGKVRNDSERFGNVPHASERKENHSLTVREAARLFEAAGVARTERSITNWCWPNRQGVARLDSYFDPNERKYYITPESVEMAIQEEKAKAAKINEPSELVGSVPKASEREQLPVNRTESAQTKDYELQIRDLEITNRVKDGIIGMKDKFIEQLQKEREASIEKLVTFSHKVGELETRLLQLEEPKPHGHQPSQN